MSLWILVEKRNSYVQKHNSLDIIFWEERRALQAEIENIEKDIIECYPESIFAKHFKSRRG